MDKLYSKTALAVKAVYCALLAPLYLIISTLISVTDSFLYVLLTVIPAGCLYTVPFWISVTYLHKYRVCGIKKYVLFDAVSCFLPAVLASLFVEIIYSVTVDMSAVSGIVTLIFTMVYFAVTILFWLVYLLLYKRK